MLPQTAGPCIEALSDPNSLPRTAHALVLRWNEVINAREVLRVGPPQLWQCGELDCRHDICLQFLPDSASACRFVARVSSDKAAKSFIGINVKAFTWILFGERWHRGVFDEKTECIEWAPLHPHDQFAKAEYWNTVFTSWRRSRQKHVEMLPNVPSLLWRPSSCCASTLLPGLDERVGELLTLEQYAIEKVKKKWLREHEDFAHEDPCAKRKK